MAHLLGVKEQCAQPRRITLIRRCCAVGALREAKHERGGAQGKPWGQRVAFWLSPISLALFPALWQAEDGNSPSFLFSFLSLCRPACGAGGFHARRSSREGQAGLLEPQEVSAGLPTSIHIAFSSSWNREPLTQHDKAL